VPKLSRKSELAVYTTLTAPRASARPIAMTDKPPARRHRQGNLEPVPAATPSTTAEDLEDLGVTLVGHRRRLLHAIAALDAEAEPS